MKCTFIYDISNIDHRDRIDEIIYYFNNISDNGKDFSFKVLDKVSKSLISDVYVMVFDSVEKINEYSQKISEKLKLIIMTENLSSSHVASCVKITPNVCYFKNDINVLAKKIYETYIAGIYDKK
ncbi:MAG: hypothetical protein N2749_05715 [Clostridia bacterium]|nr:hypothetical protein [Clostridia bacterium]